MRFGFKKKAMLDLWDTAVFLLKMMMDNGTIFIGEMVQMEAVEPIT